MKYIFNVSLFALLAMVFVGCENGDEVGNDTGGSVDIEIPVGGDYITFCTDIDTRAELVTTDYIENSFGIIGYMYDATNSWGAYKVSAKPNADVLGENQEYPTEVIYDAGTYSYGKPVRWEPMKYAFFAYAPYGNDKVVPSDENVEGTPYVTYTLDPTDATNHADVITGYAINCYAAINKYVTFRMHHRLSAVDVAAVNYYDYSYESGSVDADGAPIYTTEKVTIEIESMTAKFTNLQYGSAKIYLDNNMATEPVALDSSKDPTYPIVKEGYGYELKPSASSAFDYISVEKGTTMLFIPQEDNPMTDSDNLTVEIVVKYKKKRPGPDGTYLWTVVETVMEDGEEREYKVDVPAGSTDDYIATINPNPNATGAIKVLGKDTFTTTQTATFDQSLKEENRYYALLTFTSHAVSINILTAAAWNENLVDYEFD